MFDCKVNGIDPAGEVPPDEVIYEGDGARVELLRYAGQADGDWEVRVYDASGAHRKFFYGDFEQAFSRFAMKAQEAPNV